MITPLPTPPSRQDSLNFSSRADTFLGALPTFGDEANALATDVNTKQIAATSAAATATTQASNASSSALLAQDWATKTSATVDGTDYSSKYYALSALNAPGTSATSSTSHTVSTGSKAFTIQTGKAFAVGQFVMIANTATPANYMIGQITTHDSVTGSLVVNVIQVGGSGNFTAWTISLSVAANLANYATLVGTETLTNKTLTTPIVSNMTINDGYTEEIYTASLTGSVALTLTNGSIQVITHTGAITFTDSIAAGQSILLGLTPGANTTTWPTITWSKVGGSGTAPTLTATGVNWIVLWKIGTTLRAAFLGTA